DIAAFLHGCFFHSELVTPELIERLPDSARRPGTIHPYASLLTGCLDRNLLASLPRVETPLLLVWGRQAKPTPVEHSVRLVAVARNSRLQVIENSGAWPHHEQSATVNRLIEEFIKSEAVPAGVPQAG